jgi:hypothetical protein
MPQGYPSAPEVLDERAENLEKAALHLDAAVAIALYRVVEIEPRT